MDIRNLNAKVDNRNLTTKLVLNSYSKNTENPYMKGKNCESEYDMNKLRIRM